MWKPVRCICKHGLALGPNEYSGRLCGTSDKRCVQMRRMGLFLGKCHVRRRVVQLSPLRWLGIPPEASDMPSPACAARAGPRACDGKHVEGAGRPRRAMPKPHAHMRTPCAYMYIHINRDKHIHMYGHTHYYTYTCTYTYTGVHIHIHTPTNAHTHTPIHVYMYLCMCIHRYTNTYAYTRTSTYTYSLHICKYTCSRRMVRRASLCRHTGVHTCVCVYVRICVRFVSLCVCVCVRVPHSHVCSC